MMREWFILRFGKLPELHYDYFLEWQNRFEESEEAAITHMDLESRKKWQEVKNVWSDGRIGKTF